MFKKATKRQYMYLKNNEVPYEVSDDREYLINKYDSYNVYFIRGWTNIKKEAVDIEFDRKNRAKFMKSVKYKGKYYVLSRPYNLLSSSSAGYGTSW